MRLIGVDTIDDVKPEYKDEFILAVVLAHYTYSDPETGIRKPYMTVGCLREELEKCQDPPVPNEVVDFLEDLMVADHTKRPTAREALQHPFLTGNG